MTAVGAGPTVSHVLGEITWLLTQSPLHKALSLAHLEWLVMPPVLARQFWIFRDGEQPVGVALWAEATDAGQRKLEEGVLKPGNQLAPGDWTGGPHLWLVELVAPFADGANKHRDLMMADLVSGPLKGRAFKAHTVDLATGRPRVVTISADAGEKLKDALHAAAGSSSTVN